MFTLIEVFLLILGLIAIFVAYQAHKNHFTFKAQTETDLALLKPAIGDLQQRLKLAEHKIENPPAAQASSTTVSAPAAGPGGAPT